MQYSDVIYHSDVRWLSRGTVLGQFYSTRSEIDNFLKEKGHILVELSNQERSADLTFLVDLTLAPLTTLNKSLQGKDDLTCTHEIICCEASTFGEAIQWRKCCALPNFPVKMGYMWLCSHHTSQNLTRALKIAFEMDINLFSTLVCWYGMSTGGHAVGVVMILS